MKTIDRNEWDFSKCPDEEITACFNWEYLRELIRRDGLEAARKLNHPFIPRENYWVSDERRSLEESLNRYMPAMPYSRLPSDFRMILQPLGSVWTFKIPATELSIQPPEILHHTWGPVFFLPPAETLTLAIDWRVSDDALTKRFQEILKVRRKKMGRGGPENLRGKGGVVSVRYQLKLLAVARIWKAVGGDAIEASAFYPAVCSDPSAWPKAVEKAQIAFKYFRSQVV